MQTSEGLLLQAALGLHDGAVEHRAASAGGGLVLGRGLLLQKKIISMLNK